MQRRKAAGAIRNTERSKQKLLDAVGKIINEEGFTALKVNRVAAVASLDKTLIYLHFGGLDDLINAYLHSQNYWGKLENSKTTDFSDGGRAFSIEAIRNHYKFINQNTEFQKVLLWGLSEQKEALKHLSRQQEASGEFLFQHITDPHFKNKSEDFRAIMAILIAGSYYLNLHAAYNGVPFCGIDLGENQGRKKIEESLAFLVDASYDKL